MSKKNIWLLLLAIRVTHISNACQMGRKIVFGVFKARSGGADEAPLEVRRPTPRAGHGSAGQDGPP